jgi:hypothetical protein
LTFFLFVSTFFSLSFLSSFRLFLLVSFPSTLRSQNSSVGTAAACGMSIWGRANAFALLRSVQTGYAAHPTSYTTGTGGSCPGGKATEAWSRQLISI